LVTPSPAPAQIVTSTTAPHLTPAGAKDLLPPDVAQKRWVEDQLQLVFSRWGYHRIITSTVERLEMLMAGGAIDQATVVRLQDGDNDALGLRPELTASIARASVTRLEGVAHPHRLYYNANVFQRSPLGKHERQQEFYQAGVELLGAGGTLADAEVLLLLVDALQQVGLTDYYLLLGDAGLNQNLLETFPPELQPQIRTCIANLDRVTLERLPLKPEQQKLALLLFDLRGTPEEVLAKLAQLTLDSPLDAQRQEIVHHLKSLVELLRSSASINLILDLSLTQTINYYTGIVFQVVTNQGGSAKVLGKGGRYDRLLGLYHPQGESKPGIGFCLNIEDLQQALPLSPTPLATDWLVIPTTSEVAGIAFTYAQKLRTTDHLVRVEIELGDCDNHSASDRSESAIRKYAQGRGIHHLAWVQPDGVVAIETL
jgi:ATP phosphoribosyltransferase regulatory subunit